MPTKSKEPIVKKISLRKKRPVSFSTLSIINTLVDGNKCSSIMASISVEQYVSFTDEAFLNRGKIDGQRDTIQTTSALRIRDRMTKDFSEGAILPPVVVGVLVDDPKLTVKLEWSIEELSKLLLGLPQDQVSIIDGMQRTTVLRGIKEGSGERLIRVEFWLARETSHLTYRMLILNSGQVPWNLRRQIEVINSSLISEIQKKIGRSIHLYGIDSKRRRANAGEYQASDVIEMYLAFGLRKHQVDKESILADQFSRLDMIDAVSKDDFFNQFIETLKLLAAFDVAFSKLDVMSETEKMRFSNGRSLFDSQPSCVGFMAAAAQIIWGLIGMEKSKSEIKKSKVDFQKFTALNLKSIQGLTKQKLELFLDLKTLNERMQKSQVPKIGEFERNLFLNAYKVLFTNTLKTMTPCWRVS